MATVVFSLCLGELVRPMGLDWVAGCTKVDISKWRERLDEQIDSLQASL